MHTCKVSVRDLVEFILRSGDIVSSSTSIRDTDAMQEGTRIHKKLQKQMGSQYHAEVPLKYTSSVCYDNLSFAISVEGRADGIFPKALLPRLYDFADFSSEIPLETEAEHTHPIIPCRTIIHDDSEAPTDFIDEIKGIYRNVHTMYEPIAVHRAQALCYAYIYASQEHLSSIGIRITYCHIPTEDIRYFYEVITYEDLHQFYETLLTEYAKWLAWQIHWQEERDASIRPLEFPFVYRNGQADLVKGVYQSILRQKRLYIEAPTGVGKTIATIFPAVKAMGEHLTGKIFYLTAKTITRTVAENTFALLANHHAALKSITLTAKDKICILEKANCHPANCERAKGHFDRINDAVYDLITHESQITRDIVTQYALKHEVCPFELSLDASLWCDAVIGDYNYAFDPDSHLKRFFSDGAAASTANLFLVDEAHNLVDRARDMYSAVLIKEDVLETKRLLKTKSKKITASLESVNRALLDLKRQCDELLICTLSMTDALLGRLLRLQSVMDEFLQDPSFSEKKLSEEQFSQLLDFYFNIRSFVNVYELVDEHYLIYCDYNDNSNFCVHLQCMNPSANLEQYLAMGRSAIFFSATLLPIQYYREQLASRPEDYAIYAPSPFPGHNRLLLVGRDVSTKYSRRGAAMYARIVDYILRFVHARSGNYMVFVPSYKMLQDIYDMIASSDASQDLTLLTQNATMDEQEREEFLAHFSESPTTTTVGLCVLGGIFSEGIDLKAERLIGAVIVGTGLPMVCNENELYRQFFDGEISSFSTGSENDEATIRNTRHGFSYAYQYPGMNKVLQAAGRVIRTEQDYGCILLLDDRFLQGSYQSLFPREWFPHYTVTPETMTEHLLKFWEAHST